MKRALASSVALAAAVLVRPAAANTPARPYDAPRAESDARVPPLPPEYLVEDLGWIRFAFHPSARARVRPLLAIAGDVRSELRAQLGRDDLLRSIDVRIAAVPAEMPRLVPSEPPAYATAISFAELGLVVMSAESPLSLEPPDLETLLRHQLAHVAFDEATAHRGVVPRWLHEGFATHSAGSTIARRQTLAVAALRQKLVPIADLDDRMPFDVPEGSIAHAEAADVVRFLLAPERHGGFARLVTALGEGEGFDAALARAYGMQASVLEASWRTDVARRYGFLPVLVGAGALYLVVAIVVAVRRALQRRASESRPEDRQRRNRPRRPRDGRPPGARRGPRLHELEIPKIEHGGRWHTLH